MYGGILALARDSAMGGAVWSTLDPNAVAASLNMQICFLKPDGRKLHITSAVRYSGRMIRVAEARVFDADGRRVALATPSSLAL